MFWMFGSEEEKRPVAVAASANEVGTRPRSEEHTSELQSPCNLVCRLLLEKKKRSISHQPPVPPTPRAAYPILTHLRILSISPKTVPTATPSPAHLHRHPSARRAVRPPCR